MAQPPVPAWPFFLGAVAALGVGAFILVGVPGSVPGWSLLVAGLLLAAVGVRQGGRSATAADAPGAASAVNGPRAKSVDDYASVSAVRTMEKPKRLCGTCGSPVLPDARECPTCSAAL